MRLDHKQGCQSLAQENRSYPETHDDNAGRQSLAMREPLGNGGHGCDVAEPDAGASDHAVTKIEEQQTLQLQREARQDIAA